MRHSALATHGPWALLITGLLNGHGLALADDVPLAPFERLVGGEWHLEDSYQSFEWGVGRRSVRARSYLLVDGTAQLVSEGFWYWHPGEQRIRGVFTAIEMPVTLFDYVTRFDGDTMVSELAAYDAAGDSDRYIETWRFSGERAFEWALRAEPGGEPLMSGTYQRTP